MIEVKQTGQADPLEFDIVVSDAGGHTRHRVTMAREDYQRYTGGAVAADRCIAATFRFLLDREPKEAILAHFDVNVISRYFPEFESAIPGYLEAEE